jgi:hypothetical protein
VLWSLPERWPKKHQPCTLTLGLLDKTLDRTLDKYKGFVANKTADLCSLHQQSRACPHLERHQVVVHSPSH